MGVILLKFKRIIRQILICSDQAFEKILGARYNPLKINSVMFIYQYFSCRLCLLSWQKILAFPPKMFSSKPIENDT